MAPSTRSSLPRIRDLYLGSVNDVVAAQISAVSEVDQIFSVAVLETLERTATLDLIDDPIVNYLSMLVKVFYDEAVRGVEVETSDCDRNLSSVHRFYQLSLIHI